MSKISFDGIGQELVTFEAASGVTAGHVVKLTDNGKVAKCDAGDAFCGAALNVRGGYAGVQLRGFVTLKCAGSETVGYNSLVADGSGGVKRHGQDLRGLSVIERRKKEWLISATT